MGVFPEASYEAIGHGGDGIMTFKAMKTFVTLLAHLTLLAAAAAQTSDPPKASPSTLTEGLKKRQERSQNMKLACSAN